MQQNKERKVFLEDLPRYLNGNCKGKIQWNLCENIKVHFIYDEIEGDIVLGKYNKATRKIKVIYKEFEESINTSHILKCTLGNLVNYKKNNKIILKQKWTSEEIKLLSENYELLSNKDIQLIFPNRNIVSISSKAKELKLKKNKNTISKTQSKAGLKRMNIDYKAMGFKTYEEYMTFKESNKYMKNLATAFKEYKKILKGEQYRFSNSVVNEYDIVILFKYYLYKINLDVSKENLLKQNYTELCVNSKLDSMIQKYYSGYYDFICACFPKYNLKVWEFAILDCPNGYWHNKYNMYHCIRENIKDLFNNNIISNYSDLFKIPRNMLHKYFYSGVHAFGEGVKQNIINYLDYIKAEYFIDKYYENILFHSIEEIDVYKQIKRIKPNVYKNSKIKFYNKKYNESYIPDFISDNTIIEYFGMYTESATHEIYVNYNKKVKRKIEYFKTLEGYNFISIFPKDLYSNNIHNLVS